MSCPRACRVKVIACIKSRLPRGPRHFTSRLRKPPWAETCVRFLHQSRKGIYLLFSDSVNRHGKVEWKWGLQIIFLAISLLIVKAGIWSNLHSSSKELFWTHFSWWSWVRVSSPGSWTADLQSSAKEMQLSKSVHLHDSTVASWDSWGLTNTTVTVIRKMVGLPHWIFSGGLKFYAKYGMNSEQAKLKAHSDIFCDLEVIERNKMRQPESHLA